jgi:hypothetical protein
VKIYDVVSQSRITFIDRPADSPRADLFKCTLHWQDDSTLLIAWADHIKVARIRARASATPNVPPLFVDITAVFQLDGMVAGILPHPTPPSTSMPNSPHSAEPISKEGSISKEGAYSKEGSTSKEGSISKEGSTSLAIATTPTSLPLTSLLVLAYTPPDTSFIHGNEMPDDPAQQKRKAAERPELRIISRAGEELAADAISLTDFQSWNCNDYVLAEVDDGINSGGEGRCYVVLSPRDIVVVRPRDSRDHVAWLVARKRYEEALDAIEKLGHTDKPVGTGNDAVNPTAIGQRYIRHLVNEGRRPVHSTYTLK